jgi:hypothetical protein
MSRAVRLTTCLGLGASATATGLVCDPDTGRYALAEAINVDVVDGRLVRRPGYERLAAVGFTELFSGAADLYGLAGDGLYLIPGQGQPRLVRGGLTPGAPMAFVRLGDSVYYANGHENGCLHQGQARAWAGERCPLPDRIGRYGPPPVGHELALYAGRIWIAAGELVHCTLGAGLQDWVDNLGGYLPPFAGRVNLLAPVGGGLFVGDPAGVTYVAGNDPKTMTYARVSPAPPIPGSLALLPAGRHDSLAGHELGGDAALWAAPDGIHLGLPGGRVVRVAAIPVPAAGRLAAVATRGRYLLFERI